MIKKRSELIVNARASAILFDYFLMNKNKTVIFPVNICPIVIFTAKKAGIEFVFSDISTQSFCLDLDRIDQRFLNKDHVLFYVCSYSISDLDEEKLLKINSLYDVDIVIDKCLCYPDSFDLPVYANLVIYSTFMAKPVTLGYGAIGICNSESKAKFGNQKLPFETGDLDKVSDVIRSPFSPAILNSLSRTNWLKYEVSDPSEVNFDEYRLKIDETIFLEKPLKFEKHSLYKKLIVRDDIKFIGKEDWRTNILFDSKEARDLAYKRIFERGLYASKHYMSLAFLENNQLFPIANEVQDKVLNLFNHEGFTVEMVKETSNIVMGV